MQTGGPVANTLACGPAASNRVAMSRSAINAATGGSRRGVRGPDYTKMTEDEQIALCIQRSLALSNTLAPVNAAARSVTTTSKYESKEYTLSYMTKQQ